MRRLILLLVLVAMALPLQGAAAMADTLQPAASAPVAQQVWSDLAASPDHRATWLVVMRQAPGLGPASAIDAQLGLRGPLELLRQSGSVASMTPHYGANVIAVEGGVGALRFLAAWPDVAEIRAPRAGEAWETAASPVPAAAPDASGIIAGKVTAANGTTGLGGIRVTAYVQDPELLERWYVAGEVNTASTGTYSIGGLATGAYRLEFTDPPGLYIHEFYSDQALFYLATSFGVTDGQTTTINISLAQAGKISGTVSGADGGGGIVSSAWGYVAGAWRSLGSAISATNGAYTIGGLAPGVYRVMFSDGRDPPRYLIEYYNNVATIGEATDVTVTAGATTAGINASLGSYGKITGTVTGAGGEAIDGLYVDAYDYDATYGIWEWASWGYTDAAGYYVVDGLVTRDYRLEFSDPAGYYAGEFYDGRPDLASATNVHASLGATTPNINASLGLTTAMVSVPLVSGWNLVALAVTPANPAPAAVFAGIPDQYDLVYAYNGCDSADPWKLYDPTLPDFIPQELTAIDVRLGLWVRATAATTLSVTGTRTPTAAIPLCTGWNLIGYPAAAPRATVDALAPIAGKFNLVYAYYAGTSDLWKTYIPGAPAPVNDLTAMGAGYGYWLRSTQAATLTLTNRVVTAQGDAR